MNQPLTHYRKGFPQVSGKIISGYVVDDNCQFGTLAGLFNATSRPHWDSTTRTNTYSDVTRLSPDLAHFAWGPDYIFFWEKLVYAGDKLVSAEWNFSDFESSTYLIAGRYVDGQMVIDAQAADPRVPVLLAWFTTTLERKASGEQRAVHVRDLFPTDAHWYREASQ